MILKRQWDEYKRIERCNALNEFDLSCVKNTNNIKTNGKTIWFFWNTGLETAPPIVKRCYASLLQNTPVGWDVKVLTEHEVKTYVQLPDFVEKLKEEGKMWYALYADLIRLALLYKHGGIWCDATCYLTKTIPREITDFPLFFFEFANVTSYSPMRFENWFIRAERENYVVGRIFQGLLSYWSSDRSGQDYFVWFYIQTALYMHDIKAKEQMDEMWYCHNYDAMLVQLKYGLGGKCSKMLWNQVKNKCFIQKLTYKYDKDMEELKDTFLSQIMNL